MSAAAPGAPSGPHPPPDGPGQHQAEFVRQQFESLVLADNFPCLGARSAIRGRHHRFALYDRLGTRTAAEHLIRDLQGFTRQRTAEGSSYTTFVAAFCEPHPRDEREFEDLLWQQLSWVYRLDRVHSSPDPRVSDDPADPHFSFSVGGEAFFVVGLHAGSARMARRFAYPTLCFNPHEQFEEIRRAGHFTKMRSVIRARDEALQGELNPMLRDFGDESEAAQYSGRFTHPGWHAPLRRP